MAVLKVGDTAGWKACVGVIAGYARLLDPLPWQPMNRPDADVWYGEFNQPLELTGQFHWGFLTLLAWSLTGSRAVPVRLAVRALAIAMTFTLEG